MYYHFIKKLTNIVSAEIMTVLHFCFLQSIMHHPYHHRDKDGGETVCCIIYLLCFDWPFLALLSCPPLEDSLTPPLAGLSNLSLTQCPAASCWLILHCLTIARTLKDNCDDQFQSWRTVAKLYFVATDFKVRKMRFHFSLFFLYY